MRPPEPTLRAIVLMHDGATGGLTMQYPPEVPLEFVLHLLSMAAESTDTAIRQQNHGLILPKRGDGAAN